MDFCGLFPARNHTGVGGFYKNMIQIIHKDLFMEFSPVKWQFPRPFPLDAPDGGVFLDLDQIFFGCWWN